MTYCSEILYKKEQEIQQLKKENSDLHIAIDFQNQELQHFKELIEQVEAAKTILTTNDTSIFIGDEQTIKRLKYLFFGETTK